MPAGIDPSNSPYVYGIDLGTCNSAIAVSANGRVTILPIDGQKSMPSAVNFRPDGDVHVGREAKKRALIDPASTVLSVKRHIGNPDWKLEVNGETLSPTEITEKILSRLIAGAETSPPVDLLGTPKKAVICVPANFTEVQKRETIAAAEKANLTVISLLEEPVAAAIAYAIEKDRDQTILVYDLGGGTFDVSILEVKSTGGGARASLKILAKEGIAELGGDDFDRKLLEMAAADLLTQSEVDILDLKKDQELSPNKLREVQQKLAELCERAKIELTDAASTRIEAPDILKDGSGQVYSVDLEITREQFNSAIQPLVDQSIAAVEKALESAHIGIDDVSRIILVGGSTRVPLIRQTLTEVLGKEPYGDLDPDTVVAYGAALYAAGLDVVGERSEGTETKIDVYNTVTHNLGIATYGDRFSLLIAKNEEIPEDGVFTATGQYTTNRDNQTDLAIRIYQSDEVVEYIGPGVSFVGEFFLTGIPPKPAGQETVTVTFEIDRQNLLRVSAVASDKTEQLEIKR